MENPNDYILTSDDEALTIVETARRSLLILGAHEIQFCLRFLESIGKSVLDATGQDMLLGEDPHDLRFIEEAMHARDTGIEKIALACGFTRADALGSAAIDSLVAFVPMRPSGGGWEDVPNTTLAAAHQRALDGDVLAHAFSLYRLSGPEVSPEYALEVLRAA